MSGPLLSLRAGGLSRSAPVQCPTEAGDCRRAYEIQSGWAVSRMLRMDRFPPNGDDINHLRP